MAGKKWATPEQEEFLLSFMSEFHESAATKNYDDFFTRIWLYDDYVRIPDDIKALARAVEMRQQQLVTWWGHGTQRYTASQKIDIYLHKFYEAKRPKLNKHREITRQMYLEESESVKADIDRKYRKPLKLNDATKVKAIRELGPMLDHILKYLVHITGGWKFTVLMGRS
ncbi:hypothetical protein BDR07DRAFT_1488999 [Suillus spraguei]|nr:hypothetical protein BDR07DRAFT_1488999 [Suillus spraguei]